MVEIQELANDFILQAHIDKLKLTMRDFEQICARMGYTLLSYVQGQEIIESCHLKGNRRYNGFVFLFGEYRIIFYKDTLAYHEKLFTIAHEIGHIFLGHMYNGIKQQGKGQQDVQEREADMFAYCLLAPPSILKACHVKTPVQLTQLTYLKDQRCAQAFMNLSNYVPTPEGALLAVSFSSFIQQHDFAQIPRKRKRIFERMGVVYMVMVLATIGIWLSTKLFPQFASQPAVTMSKSVVYITAAGTKYHRCDCYQITSSQALAIFTDDAIRLGYEPCKTCGPKTE